MKQRLVKALLLGSCVLNGAAMAADLFENRTLRDIAPKARWSTEDTQGGYALYPGEGKWEFVSGAVQGARGPDPLDLGLTQWNQWDGNTLEASMAMTVNINRSNQASHWLGSPCAGLHLMVVDRPRGREDHCFIVDAQRRKVGNAEVTFIAVRITHSAGGGRYMVLDVAVNPAQLGHFNTSPGDWAESQWTVRPDRKEFLDRFGIWAESLYQASFKAFGYDQPRDAYNAVPSWRTLFSVPDALAQRQFSQSFLSMLNDQKYKSGFKAIAYAHAGPGRTRWSRNWNHETQEDANQKALAACEKDKSASMPACVLYAEEF